jgi:murein DD-endopeptidase MepM/ murein hydrolase activator NlpD
VALLSLTIPSLAYAKSLSGPILRVPENREVGNSQTMDLLEGYLNINPAGIGGPALAIIDGSALSSVDDTGSFIDLGKSGTGEISIYTVRSGDTLGGIAEMFGVSVNTIVWANDLKSKTLKQGQELIILPITGVKHTVKSGDTLQSVAKKYKADLDDVLSYNGLTSTSKIALGDVIIIPDGVISAAAAAVAKPGTQTSVASGYFIRPIKGGIKSQGIHGYNGIDIAASVGTPVLASAGGTVIIAKASGYNGGYGLYVAIKHPNGTQTVYGHMSKVNVSVGQEVLQGQIIGAVGNTGRSTGAHLHFEIRGAKNPF